MHPGRFVLLLLATLFVTGSAATAQQTDRGINVIVLDAGHGGSDPGATYGGVTEKSITLKVVLRLGKRIEQEMPGVKVVYTRTTDKALGPTKYDDLQARADIANKAGGDLFLSVHVNASRSSAARGTETLIMGESPKEQRYNEDALYENNRDDLIDMSDERTAAIVRAYIQNLQFTYGEYSQAMAGCIQKNYKAAGRASRGIKPQLLRVLYATDMPGVLTEIGFLSNPQEAAYLKSDKGIDEIVQALLRSVQEYSARLSQLRSEMSDDAPAPAPKPAAEAAPTAEKPAAPAAQPAEKPAAEGARFTIQVRASASAVSVKSKEFKSYRNNVRELRDAGKYKYKYTVGDYATREEAQQALPEVRKEFPDAFIVRCAGGRIVK